MALIDAAAATAMDGKLGLTPREVQQCKRLFQTFDEDNSGTIDQSELREVMRCLGSTLNDVELSELMSSIDTNDSGEVEYHEFLFLIKLYKESCRFKTLHKSKVATERIKQATKTKLLLPDDPVHWGWSVVILIITMYFTIIVTYYDTQKEAFHQRLVPAHAVASLILMVDIVICHQTMVISAESRTSIHKCDINGRVNVKYLKGWFVTDALSALPLDILFCVLDMNAAAMITSHLRLFRLVKVPFLFKTSPRSTMTKNYAIFYFHYVPIIQGTFWWITAIHLITCSSLAISPKEDYITAVYWVLYTITSVGYGDVPVDSQEKRVLACLLCIGGLLVNGIMVGILTVKMQKTNVVSEGREKMVETLSLMRLFHIPEKMQEEILAFQHHLIDNTLSTSVSKVIDKLPSTIKDNVEMFIKLDFISHIKLFEKISEDCKITLAASLLSTVASPEEILIMVGDAAERVMFIAHGFVDVFDETGNDCETRIKGDFFGEEILLGAKKSTISAKSLTYCDILILPKGDILAIMKIYPTFISIVRQELSDMSGLCRGVRKDSTTAVQNPLVVPQGGDGDPSLQDGSEFDQGVSEKENKEKEKEKAERGEEKEKDDVKQESSHSTKGLDNEPREKEEDGTDSGHSSSSLRERTHPNSKPKARTGPRVSITGLPQQREHQKEQPPRKVKIVIAYRRKGKATPTLTPRLCKQIDAYIKRVISAEQQFLYEQMSSVIMAECEPAPAPRQRVAEGADGLIAERMQRAIAARNSVTRLGLGAHNTSFSTARESKRASLPHDIGEEAPTP